MQVAPDYLNPEIPADLKRTRIPIIKATAESLAGYGNLVTDPYSFDLEIVRWPAPGHRPVDPDSGDEGGTIEGVFISEWKGEILYGRNEAVKGHYILGYGNDLAKADKNHIGDPTTLLLWHANYHPDGGQLFCPLIKEPFIVPLALPGDDVTPQDFVCFYFTGDKGLYIHLNIWHEGVFALSGVHQFFDKQGAVHARASVDFAREFNCLLEVPLGDLK